MNKVRTVMYTMYMMYTVSEFRKNIREALSQAEHGEIVEINRHGRVFTLRPSGFVTMVDSSKTVAPGVNVVLDGVRVITPKVATGLTEPVITQKNKDMEFCKHGAVKGLCKKGCK